uniref:Coiled-coil domain containing 190 n=1 Tax=Jaculus jaculus TaxID=51337 RepID=A0A8C5KK38_JACJA
MNRGMAGQPLYKHFDLERKSARQAEARLSLRLAWLETICLYHVKSLAREQRQLQKELQRLQQAEILKKRSSSYLSNGPQKPKDPMLSPQRGQKHIVPEPKIRAMATNQAHEIKTKTQVSTLCDTGLKDPRRSKEILLRQCSRSGCIKEETSQVQEEGCVNPPKSIDPKGTSVPCQDDEAYADNTEHGPVSSPPGQCGTAHHDETKSENADPMPGGDSREQNSRNSVECSGSFKDEFTKPTFLELFEKAKHAHYLRHRYPPESERLLSIGEIFGHRESLLPQAGKL